MTFLAVLISAFVFLFVEIGGPLLIYSAIGAISNVLMVILFIVFTVFGALADAVIKLHKAHEQLAAAVHANGTAVR